VERREPLAFFVLVIVLSIPFWLAGALVNIQLLPGIPLSALMFVCPVTAAVILIDRESGTPGVAQLLKRSLDLGGRHVLLVPGAGLVFRSCSDWCHHHRRGGRRDCCLGTPHTGRARGVIAACSADSREVHRRAPTGQKPRSIVVVVT
jgi:hypothetical protein